MADKVRFDWLARHLGLTKAAEVIEDTKASQQLADGAGLERKAVKPPEDEQKPAEETAQEPPPAEKPADTPPPAETPAEEEEKQEGDVVSEASAKLAEQVFAAAEGNLATLTQEQLAQILADALRPAVEGEQAPTGEGEGAPPPPPKEQQMEDKSKGASAPVPTPADHEPHDQEAVKAFTGFVEQILHDQGEMAKSYQAVSTQAGEAAEIAKALKPVVEQLAAAVQAIQAQLNDRPRSASAAPETTLDKDSEAAKAVESALKKSVNGNKTVLGLPVKE